MLDFRLVTFLTAAREGNFTKAGELLGLTQPAVTQHIHHLEELFGAQLFEKSGRGVQLTQAGEFLQHEGEILAVHSRQIRKELLNFEGGRRFFSLGATLTVGEFLLPRYLARYKRGHERRELNVTIENTFRCLELLQKGKIDLAVIEGPFDSSRFLHEPFLFDELLFITAADSPWARESVIHEEKINTYPLVLRERGSGTREHFEQFLGRLGLHIDDSSVVMEVGSLSAIKVLCESGLGCSVMSRHAVERELLLGSLSAIPFSSGILERQITFVYTEFSPMPFVGEFIGFCRDMHAEIAKAASR